MHRWARGHGLAVSAVGLVCAYVKESAVGDVVAIRVEPANTASVRVAHECGFQYRRRYPAKAPTGNPTSYDLYLRGL